MTHFYHEKRMHIRILDPRSKHYRTVDVRHPEISEARSEAKKELKEANQALDREIAIPALMSRKDQVLFNQAVLETGLYYSVLLFKVREEAQRVIGEAGMLVTEIEILKIRIRHVIRAQCRRHKNLRNLLKGIPERHQLQRSLMIKFCLDLGTDRFMYLDHLRKTPNGGQWPPYISDYFDYPVKASLEPKPQIRNKHKRTKTRQRVIKSKRSRKNASD